MIVKKIRGLHSLKDLTIRIKTRIDDSHAPPGAHSSKNFKTYYKTSKLYTKLQISLLNW